MASPSTKYDALFMEIASSCSGLDPLLTSFFSFLHRKTDLYIVADTEDLRSGKAKMGFMEGAAENVVLSSFRKFPMKRLGREGEGREGEVGSESKRQAKKKQASVQRDAKQSAGKPSGGAPVTNTVATTTTTPSPPASSASSASQPTHPSIHYNDKGEQIPVGNGGVTSSYHWTQTLYETTVYLTVPDNTRSKDLAVVIAPSSVSVVVKATNEVLLKGDYPHKIKTDESLWNLDTSTSQLILTLDKVQKTWWSSVIKGDVEIDTSKVDSSMKIDEYDEKTQGEIRKIVAEQRMKRMGLMTEEERAQAELMKGLPPVPGQGMGPDVEYPDNFSGE
jgi:hypothetical protein